VLDQKVGQVKEAKQLEDVGNVKIIIMAKKKSKKNPCWKGYQMVGMKKKGGRNVPNCVPNKKK
jgi:hypothetical protein